MLIFKNMTKRKQLINELIEHLYNDLKWKYCMKYRDEVFDTETKPGEFIIPPERYKLPIIDKKKIHFIKFKEVGRILPPSEDHEEDGGDCVAFQLYGNDGLFRHDLEITKSFLEYYFEKVLANKIPPDFNERVPVYYK